MIEFRIEANALFFARDLDHAFELLRDHFKALKDGELSPLEITQGHMMISTSSELPSKGDLKR